MVFHHGHGFSSPDKSGKFLPEAQRPPVSRSIMLILNLLSGKDLYCRKDNGSDKDQSPDNKPGGSDQEANQRFTAH